MTACLAGMSECITDELLAAWASGDAAPEVISSVRTHIASCTNCRTVAAEVARREGRELKNRRPTSPPR